MKIPNPISSPIPTFPNHNTSAPPHIPLAQLSHIRPIYSPIIPAQSKQRNHTITTLIIISFLAVLPRVSSGDFLSFPIISTNFRFFSQKHNALLILKLKEKPQKYPKIIRIYFPSYPIAPALITIDFPFRTHFAISAPLCFRGYPRNRKE